MLEMLEQRYLKISLMVDFYLSGLKKHLLFNLLFPDNLIDL